MYGHYLCPSAVTSDHTSANFSRTFIVPALKVSQTTPWNCVVPGLTRPSDIQHYTVYNVPDDQHWCFEMLESLSEIRDDNWPMTFNEENSDKAILEENDIEDLAPDNITIFLSRIL